MTSRYLFTSLLVTGTLLLPGCENKKQLAEIEELKTDLESARKDYDAWKERFEEEEQKSDELEEENFKLKREVGSLEKQVASAERDLERLRARAEREKEVKQRAPSAREKLAAAKEVAAGHLEAIVTVTGDVTKGSGTLVKADEKVWIYLPASTVAGNTRLEITTSDGTKLDKFGVFELAPDADLARLELKDEVEGALDPVEDSGLASGGSMLGVGNADTIIDSRVYEVGAKVIDAGSRFRETSTGSPMFSGESGALFGILAEKAAAERTLWPQRGAAFKAQEVSRIDREVKWTAVPIATFLAEAKTLADADRLTRLVFAFAATTPSTSGVAMSARVGGSMTAEEVLEENKKVPAVEALFKLDEWLKEKGERASKADLDRQIGRTYSELLRISSRNTKKFEGERFSPYHSKVAAQSLEWRKEAEKKLAATAKSQE
ncbi:MAG: hypothetical protein AAGI48_05385 [Verrucomicrobiota bacterium]